MGDAATRAFGDWFVLNSPDPVYWQIDTAWDRLTAQTLPFMAILCATVYASIIRAHQHE